MALALARCAICTEAREERRSDDYFDEQVSYNDNNNSNTNNNCFLIIYIYIYIYIIKKQLLLVLLLLLSLYDTCSSK